MKQKHFKEFVTNMSSTSRRIFFRAVYAAYLECVYEHASKDLVDVANAAVVELELLLIDLNDYNWIPAAKGHVRMGFVNAT